MHSHPKDERGTLYVRDWTLWLPSGGCIVGQVVGYTRAQAETRLRNQLQQVRAARKLGYHTTGIHAIVDRWETTEEEFNRRTD